MKKLEFKLKPQDVRIGADEILADLNYPVSPQGRRDLRRAPERRPYRR